MCFLFDPRWIPTSNPANCGLALTISAIQGSRTGSGGVYNSNFPSRGFPPVSVDCLGGPACHLDGHYFGHHDRLSARARGIADVSERGDDPSIASQASRRQQRGGGRGNQAETPRSEQGARGKIETKRNPLFTGPATRWSSWGRGVLEGRAIVPRGSNARKPSWEYPSDASRRFSGAFAALTRAARVPFRSFPRVRASAFSPPGEGARPPRSSAAMLRRDRSDA